MKNSLIVGVIFIASFLVSIVLSNKAEDYRIKDRQGDVGEEYVKRSKTPTAGLDAVFADFMWMRTYLRRTPQAPKDASDEVKEEIRKRIVQTELVGYTNVVRLDPTFSKAYDFATLRLMVELPDQALMLADKAMLFCKQDEQKFAERAAHISSKVKKDYQKALTYYRKLVSGGAPSKDYLGRQYLRTLVRMRNLNPHSEDLTSIIKMIEIYHDEYKAVKAKAQQGLNAGMDPKDPNNKDLPENITVGDAGVESTWIRDFLYEKVRSFLTQMRNDQNRKKISAQKVAQIEKIFKELGPPKHLCQTCLTHELAPGDKFCANCGTKSKPYGVCTYKSCKDKNIILKGGFCHDCGKKAPGKMTDI